MLAAAGLLLRLCTQLLRLVRLRTRLGLPQILVVGDSRPSNPNESPTLLRRLSRERAGVCFGYSHDLNRALSRKGEGACSGIAPTKHCFQPVQMMLQLVDNIVRKGIVFIDMAREWEWGACIAQKAACS